MADRRTWGKRLVVGGGIVVGVGLLLYLIGGRGTGRNGRNGKRTGCQVRMRRDATLLDGKPATVADIVAACKDVDLAVAGDVLFGDVEAMRQALEAAGIPFREAAPLPAPTT